MRSHLQDKKRIVVKIGSSILVDSKGRLSSARCRTLVQQVVELQNESRQVILVSSGAIAAGLHNLDRREKPESISLKQAIAALGQPLLMREYQKCFQKYDLRVAQMLLTRGDIEDSKRFLNARHTLAELLKLKIVPIINENDTVATEELKMGDNDNLSAWVSHLVEADLLIILSDVAGVYSADPRLVKGAKRISQIRQIDPELRSGASDTLRLGSTGGMRTKLDAADRAQSFGIPTIIADGRDKQVLRKIFSGEDVGTLIERESA